MRFRARQARGRRPASYAAPETSRGGSKPPASTKRTRRERLSAATGIPVVVLDALDIAGDVLPRSAIEIVRQHCGTALSRALRVSGAARASILLAAIQQTARADDLEAA